MTSAAGSGAGGAGALQDPWHIHVPAVFRALADPTERVHVPRPVNAGFEYVCATWGALHYTLTCLLGWTDVGRGLAWWYDADQPTDESPVLNLVKQVWGSEGLIDYYAAWAWKPADNGWLLPQAQDPLGGPSPTELGKTSRYPNEDWWRAFVRRGAEHHHDPFYGGSDALHLSAHTGREASSPSLAPIVQLMPDRNRVVLVTEGLAHWLADLGRLQAQLPHIGERSWRVEVFDRRVGYLGEYRRSRVTGRWFQGKHSIHIRGAREQ